LPPPKQEIPMTSVTPAVFSTEAKFAHEARLLEALVVEAGLDDGARAATSSTLSSVA